MVPRHLSGGGRRYRAAQPMPCLIAARLFKAGKQVSRVRLWLIWIGQSGGSAGGPAGGGDFGAVPVVFRWYLWVTTGTRLGELSRLSVRLGVKRQRARPIRLGLKPCQEHIDDDRGQR